MSLLRALRAYVGLGPDEELENDYLDGLNALQTETEIDLRESEDPGDEPDAAQSARSHARRSAPAREHAPRPSQEPRAAGKRRPPNPPGSATRPRSERDPEDRFGPSPFKSEQDSSPRNAVRRGRPENEPAVSGLDEAEGGDDADDREGDGGVVHSLDAVRMKPKTIVPESFSEAKTVADDFMFAVPVVLNLQGADRELARRMIDFASGLCYGLNGAMEKIAPQVFLLTPDGMEVSETDRDRIRERGYAR